MNKNTLSHIESLQEDELTTEYEDVEKANSGRTDDANDHLMRCQTIKFRPMRSLSSRSKASSYNVVSRPNSPSPTSDTEAVKSPIFKSHDQVENDNRHSPDNETPRSIESNSTISGRIYDKVKKVF